MTLFTIAILTTGCITADENDVVKTGRLRTDSTFLQLGDANNVEVNLAMGWGDLQVRAGGDDLMEGNFTYNVGKWKPRFSYEEEGEVWNLTVVQPNQDIKVESDAKNEWDVIFGTFVPMEMNIDIGAGNGNIQAGWLNLVSLSVGTGAGDLTVDLIGDRYTLLVVRIGTGAGKVDLIVPSSYGIQVEVTQGSGTVVAPGFEMVDDRYTNDAFDTAPILILIAVSIGSGNLTILEVP
jgi:hypothetical protein